MSAEERLADVVIEAEAEAEEEDDEEEMPSYLAWRRHQRRRARRKNREIMDEFLGESRRAQAVGIMPRYYAELATWALHRYLERQNWSVATTLGHGAPEPIYIDVSTGCDRRENLLVCGQMLIERDGHRLILTVDVNPRYQGSVLVEGPVEKKDEIEAFVEGILTIAKEENLYRGQKIEFSGRVHFLNVKSRSWDDIVLDSATKREVRANTADFLRRGEHWVEYGIPRKRGVLLAGEPGTGKTLICKALMAEAEGITCITTNAYKLCADEYISDLYEMAEDLSPCIVFIEDIDLIGLNREEYHYQHGPALLSLLNVLDGVEEKQEIVTVATTNNWEALDRAISRRPSRFDRVIRLSLPSLEERRELVELLCRKIPVDGRTREYIAGKAEHCTPAQLQEIVYGLAIESPEEASESTSPCLKLSRADIDRAISRVNGKNGRRLGFDIERNHRPGVPVFLEDPEEDEC